MRRDLWLMIDGELSGHCSTAPPYLPIAAVAVAAVLACFLLAGMGTKLCFLIRHSWHSWQCFLLWQQSRSTEYLREDVPTYLR
jgi:hypothetical protein